MNAWPFVVAAWTLTLGVSAGLAAWSWRSMQRAEAEAETLKR